MIRCARAVVLALALAACQQETGGLPPVGAAAVDAARAACERRGGSFAPGGTGALTCFTTPRDAGQQCRTADDCSTACLARSRTCAPVAPLLGCNEILTATGARVTQCID